MKCVLIIDKDLPLGLVANTAAVLALSLGGKMKHVVGPDVVDASGFSHPGITTLPIPALSASAEAIRELRERLYADDCKQVSVVDFSWTAQSCKSYREYAEKLSSVRSSELQYLGLALYGPKSKVSRLTGSLALLR